jgi:hypothetical protein
VSAPIDRVLQALEPYDVHPSGRDRWRARCPGHNGKNRTVLTVGIGDDDCVLLHCHGGCEIEAVVGALGLDLADLYPARDTGAGPLARRRMLSATQALEQLERESLIVLLIARDMRAGETPSAEDFDRLLTACTCIGELRREVYA